MTRVREHFSFNFPLFIHALPHFAIKWHTWGNGMFTVQAMLWLKRESHWKVSFGCCICSFNRYSCPVVNVFTTRMPNIIASLNAFHDSFLCKPFVPAWSVYLFVWFGILFLLFRIEIYCDVYGLAGFPSQVPSKYFADTVYCSNATTIKQRRKNIALVFEANFRLIEGHFANANK